jgi:murein DD-endopeptidase MepM/ murein hydrolase activator NlpD
LMCCLRAHLIRSAAMNKTAQTYTVVIIPDRKGGKTLSVCLSRTMIMLLLTLFFLLAGAATLLLVKSAVAAKKLQYFNMLRKSSEYLTIENQQLRSAYQKTMRIDSFALYLEKLSALTQTQEKTKTNIKTNETKAREQTTDIEKKKNGNKPAADITSERSEDFSIKTTPSVLPVEGWITQQFNIDTSQGTDAHPGIDIAAAEGLIIKAPAPGVVLAVETDQYYGNMIVIKHDEEFITRYGHCEKVFLAKGEKVELGQTIALVGNTGHSTAPHLHYEVIRNGKNVNPLEYISPAKK